MTTDIAKYIKIRYDNDDKIMDRIANHKIIRVLCELGLDEKEAKVYLASLALGSTTAQKIAEEAGVKRTTTYNIIDELRNKGLIIVEFKGFKKFFTPAPPERLEAMVLERKEILEANMPALEAIYNLKADEGSIKYYKGIKACQDVYWGLLSKMQSGEDYLVLTDQKRWFELDPSFAKKFIEKRAKRNINIRLLFQESEIAREHQKFQNNYNESIKILPPGSPLNTNLIITPHQVVIHQLVPPIFTMVIENQNIIELHRETFEIIWRSLSN